MTTKRGNARTQGGKGQIIKKKKIGKATGRRREKYISLTTKIVLETDLSKKQEGAIW